jgi:hypothetical protein
LNLFKLRPTRDAAISDDVVVSDLDAIAGKEVAFKWRGRKYLIRPMTTEQFFNLSRQLVELDKLTHVKDDNGDALLGRWAAAYAKLFKIACPEITLNDVEDMTQAQIAALFNLILECVAGKAQVDIEKKKRELLNSQFPNPDPTQST